MTPRSGLLVVACLAACAAPTASAFGGAKVPTIMGLSLNSEPTNLRAHASRRAALAGAASALAGLAAGPKLASAADGEELVEVYFGCGCFWHVQHEFVEAERKILGRDASSYTALVGYAGGGGEPGAAGGKDTVGGKVCYHNMQGVADYGKLGHAEVVKLNVPSGKFGLIAEEYFKLFDSQGNRPDQRGDRGLEYRNLVGLPGGASSPLYKELVAASERQGDKLDFAKVGEGPASSPP